MIENDDNLIDNVKTQLYDLYIDIKTFLVSSERERQNNDIQKEISSTTEVYTIIKYLKNCIKIIIEDKKINELKNTNNNNQDNNNMLKQFESYIKKLENDLKYSIKKQFMFKIQKDSLEMKIRGYMEIEEEYEELKEKVRYEGGKFLNNDRKDNEIIILRRENSNLKKEINKIEEKAKNFEKKYNDGQDIINGLKFKVSQLNKKIEELKDELKNIKNTKNTNNENNNDIFSISKNIIEHYNKTVEKNKLDKINISNINNINNIGYSKLNVHLKRDLTNYQLPINNFNNNLESAKSNPIKALNTIDSSNKFVMSNFNKIYNNNKNIIAPIRNNKFKNAKNKKSNSVSRKSEENEKKNELFNKYLSGNTNIKYDAPHTRIRSLNKINKNISYKLPLAKHSFNNIQKEDKNLYEHSALNIVGFNKIS